MFKKRKDKNTKQKKIKKEIPDEIKILYGRFYVYSLIYIIFFGLIYPFLLIKSLSVLSSIIIFMGLGIFYIYIIRDVLKKKGRFNSTLFALFVLMVVMSLSFSLVKFLV